MTVVFQGQTTWDQGHPTTGPDGDGRPRPVSARGVTGCRPGFGAACCSPMRCSS